MRAGKHVQVEIPLADSWADAAAVADVRARDRTRLHGRTHPTLQSLAPVDPPAHRRRRALHPADGRADLLLSTHATSTRSDSRAVGSTTSCGITPRTRSTSSRTSAASRSSTPTSWPDRSHPELRHSHGHVDPAADARRGKLCTLSLSFNNDGPLGTFFRYICDNGTYIARYDDLVTGRRRVDRRDRASRCRWTASNCRTASSSRAIREGREPNSSIESVWTATAGPRTQLQEQLDASSRSVIAELVRYSMTTSPILCR